MPANKEDNAREIARIKNLTNPFAILGLEANASIDESIVKKNYRKLALKVHPDHNNDSQDAKVAFQNLQQAFAILIDPIKRFDLQAQFNASNHGPAATTRKENPSKTAEKANPTNFKASSETTKPVSTPNTHANTANKAKSQTNNFSSSYTPYGSYYGAHYSYTKPAPFEKPQEPDYEAIAKRKAELERKIAAQRALDKQWQEREKMRAEQQKAQQAAQVVPSEQGIWSVIKSLASKMLALLMDKPKLMMPQDDIKIEVVDSMHKKDFAKFVNKVKKQTTQMGQDAEKRIKSARKTAKEQDENLVKVKLSDPQKSDKKVTFDSKTLRQERRKTKKKKSKNLNNPQRNL